MAQPIVSVSLGCDAVFLMGGHTRHVPPSALRLRSGDVLVLAGPARACYHGEEHWMDTGTGQRATLAVRAHIGAGACACEGVHYVAGA